MVGIWSGWLGFKGEGLGGGGIRGVRALGSGVVGIWRGWVGV